MALEVSKTFYILMHADDGFIDIFMSRRAMLAKAEEVHPTVVLKDYRYSQVIYDSMNGVSVCRYQIKKFNITLTADVSVN